MSGQNDCLETKGLKMRKDKLSIVLVHVRQRIAKTFGESTAEKLSIDTLLDMSSDMGLVSGKRGRDGGFLVTDEGLSFIGENVEAFHAAEARAEVAKEAQAKETRKEATKARKAALERDLQALTKAA